MTAADGKAVLRAEMKRRADALSPEYVRASSEKIAEALFASELWRGADSVFLFVGVGKEPDTASLLSRALWEGKAVFIPKCLPADENRPRRMLAVRIRSADELIPGTYGIPEPRYDPVCPPEVKEPGSLGLILVPCVTANAKGERLGHGAGYYDRFLAGREANRPPAVCLCHAALVTEEIPMSERDVKMDALITEEGIVWCEG